MKDKAMDKRYKERLLWIERTLREPSRYDSFDFFKMLDKWPETFPLDEALELATKKLQGKSASRWFVTIDKESTVVSSFFATDIDCIYRVGIQKIITLLERGAKFPFLRGLKIKAELITLRWVKVLEESGLANQIEALSIEIGHGFAHSSKTSEEAWKLLWELSWPSLRRLSFESDGLSIPLPDDSCLELDSLFLKTSEVNVALLQDVANSGWLKELKSLTFSTSKRAKVYVWKELGKWSCPKLNSFSWIGAGCNKESMKHLKKSEFPNLQDLCISNSDVCLKALLELVEIPWFSKLTHLDLSVNPLGAKAGVIFAKNTAHFESLEVRSCGFGSKGIAALAHAPFSKLIHLDISSNDMQNEGLEAIIEHANWPVLEELRFDAFRAKVSSKVFCQFAKSKLPSLKSFVSGESIKKKEILALLASPSFDSAFRFSDGSLEWEGKQSAAKWDEFLSFSRLANFSHLSFKNCNWSELHFQKFMVQLGAQLSFLHLLNAFKEPVELKTWKAFFQLDKLCTLKRLVLHDIHLGDEVIQLLSKSQHIRLRELSLVRCRVSDIGLKMLVESPAFLGLSWIMLERHSISNEGAIFFAENADFPLLAALDLSRGKIGKQGLAALWEWKPSSVRLNIRSNRARKE